MCAEVLGDSEAHDRLYERIVVCMCNSLRIRSVLTMYAARGPVFGLSDRQTNARLSYRDTSRISISIDRSSVVVVSCVVWFESDSASDDRHLQSS